MSEPPVLRVENLTQRFPSGQRDLEVLHGVSFELPGGATAAIVGPSGSGKTTLLGLCAGLDRPSDGRVTLCGEDLAALDEDRRARLRRDQIGFVFQSFRLLETLTARENVMVPLELQGTADAAQRAAELLAQVGLQERLDHYPHQLSGGEQQRVAVARAFVHRPRLLLADEPTGNLDEETGERIVDLLFRLNAEHGTALLLVTHDPVVAARTDRRLVLRSGRLVAEETRADRADAPAS